MEQTQPRVLVVDDDTGLRNMLEMALEDAGYQVVQATNGQEALAQIRRQKPAIVILDLMMPVMDGWQFLEEVKLEPELQDLAVILLSANREVGITAQNSNVKAYLPKPFDLDELLSYLERYL